MSENRKSRNNMCVAERRARYTGSEKGKISQQLRDLTYIYFTVFRCGPAQIGRFIVNERMRRSMSAY